VAELGDKRESLKGVQAKDDSASYRVWHKTDLTGGPSGKYLVDDSGKAVWLVDPGINGVHSTRPDGTEVRKFDAPKATLVSYIIKGILDRELPWELIIFGAMLALAMEFCGMPSLVISVGAYLPISTTAPMFIGGLIRWLMDRRMRREPALAKLGGHEFNAVADRGPGVLFASGYIAGGAIAGILIAFLAGVMGDFDAALQRWAAGNNPFYEGPYADLLTLLPFLGLTLLLWLVARGSWLSGGKAAGK
jgi:OPT oligopeptide transporter protein